MERDEILQKAAEKIYRQVQIPMAILDRQGNVLAAMPGDQPAAVPNPEEAEMTPNEMENGVSMGNWSFFVTSEEDQGTYFAALQAPLESCRAIGRMVGLYLSQCLRMEDRIGQASTIRGLVLGKITVEEAKVYAQNMGIDSYQPRCVYLVETDPEVDPEADLSAIDILRNLFPDGDENYVFSPELHRILLILAVRETGEEAKKQVLSTAQMISDMLSAEAAVKVSIAVGSIAETLDELPDSYQDARTSMTVGQIFYPEKNIHDAGSQGIGRMVYQMDRKMCCQFLQESVQGLRVNQLDPSTLEMITAFFDNNLTLSETARQLYSHRNTLVYRLDKLQRQTGLDIRVFEDAFTFKLAMMVSKYLDQLE